MVSYENDTHSCSTIGLNIMKEKSLALVDTGSEVSAISSKYREWIEEKKRKLRCVPGKSMCMVGAFGDKTRSREQVWLEILLEMEIEVSEMAHSFVVAPKLTADVGMIIGMDLHENIRESLIQQNT